MGGAVLSGSGNTAKSRLPPARQSGESTRRFGEKENIMLLKANPFPLRFAKSQDTRGRPLENHSRNGYLRVALRRALMAKQAIWVMLKAKPGKEQDVEAFLAKGAAMSNDEPGTVTWYGVRMAPGVYGVFDTFNDEDGPRRPSQRRHRQGTDGQCLGVVLKRAPHREDGNLSQQVASSSQKLQPGHRLHLRHHPQKDYRPGSFSN